VTYTTKPWPDNEAPDAAYAVRYAEARSMRLGELAALLKGHRVKIDIAPGGDTRVRVDGIETDAMSPPRLAPPRDLIGALVGAFVCIEKTNGRKEP